MRKGFNGLSALAEKILQEDPPAAWYQFTSNRRGEHPSAHLASYQGWMHADGYAGFNDLYRSGVISEVACMAHTPLHRLSPSMEYRLT